MCDCHQNQDSESIRLEHDMRGRMMEEFERRLDSRLRRILREAEGERAENRMVLWVIGFMIAVVLLLAVLSGVNPPEQVKGTVPVGTTP